MKPAVTHIPEDADDPYRLENPDFCKAMDEDLVKLEERALVAWSERFHPLMFNSDEKCKKHLYTYTCRYITCYI